MKINALPKSRLGKWTVGMNIYCLLIAIILGIFAEILKVITSEIVITILGATFVIVSIATFFTGIIAFIINKERSILIFLAILIGFVVLAFIFGDILGLPDVNLPGF